MIIISTINEMVSIINNCKLNFIKFVLFQGNFWKISPPIIIASFKVILNQDQSGKA